jgi:hypothetical protein
LDQKRPEVKVEFQEVQKGFDGFLSVLRNSADMLLEQGVAASFFLFFHEPEENSAFYHILPVEFGAPINLHELRRIPALESSALGRSLFINGTGFLLFVIEDAVSFADFALPHFNHFLISRHDPTVNIVSDHFALANGIKLFHAEKAPTHQGQIVCLEGRAGFHAALSATDTVGPELVQIHTPHFRRTGPITV